MTPAFSSSVLQLQCSYHWPLLGLFLHCSLFHVPCLLTLNIIKCHQINTRCLQIKRKESKDMQPALLSHPELGTFHNNENVKPCEQERWFQIPEEGSRPAGLRCTKHGFRFLSGIHRRKDEQPTWGGMKMLWNAQIISSSRTVLSNFKRMYICFQGNDFKSITN